MKKNRLLVATALIGCMVIGAAAATGIQSVTAQLRPDFTLEVNGSDYILRDSNGNEVAPLLYNGTTYLPIRSMGEILGAEVSWDGKTQTVIVTTDEEATALIGEAKAKKIALNDAGLSASKVTFLEIKLDWEKGRQIYDVEFYTDDLEYDYHIDARTGDVLSYDHDMEGNPAPDDTTVSITKDKAKKIALKDAGLSASKVSYIQVKLDWEAGRRVYDVEFYSGNTEYDYVIDAATGDILSFDHDVEDLSIPSSDERISREKAIKLAKAKAPGATLVEIELDFEDGRAIYEGELRDGETEYEFEIDADTGDFIKWDVEVDD